MSDSKEEKISNLLQEGLERYGAGDVAQAFLLWNEVLEMDPENEDAIDYIRDADRRAKPRDEETSLKPRSIVDDARGLLRSESPEAALELLVSGGTAGDLATEAMVELLRATLFRDYRQALGGATQVPRLAAGAQEDLQTRNLPPTAGFLISMIDGQTPLGDLVSVSGMDRFDVMRSMHQMFEAGILEWVE